MANRRLLIIANWKMNPATSEKARALFESSLPLIRRFPLCDVVLCPPALYIGILPKRVRDVRYGLGAQDAFWEEKGAYTGEISPAMLKSLGCTHVIVGHSERRRICAETDEMVARKVHAVLRAGLTAILCVGEETRMTGDDEYSEVGAVVGRQLDSALKSVSRVLAQRLVIAYEPIWAISTSPHARADTPTDAVKAMLFIRKTLRRLYPARTADAVRIIYGGSVSDTNAASFFAEEAIGGALVGGASLHPARFGGILAAAERAQKSV